MNIETRKYVASLQQSIGIESHSGKCCSVGHETMNDVHDWSVTSGCVV